MVGYLLSYRLRVYVCVEWSHCKIIRSQIYVYIYIYIFVCPYMPWISSICQSATMIWPPRWWMFLRDKRRITSKNTRSDNWYVTLGWSSRYPLFSRISSINKCRILSQLLGKDGLSFEVLGISPWGCCLVSYALRWCFWPCAPCQYFTKELPQICLCLYRFLQVFDLQFYEGQQISVHDLPPRLEMLDKERGGGNWPICLRLKGSNSCI